MKNGILFSLGCCIFVTTSLIQAAPLAPHGAFFSAEVLYWQVREGGADLVGERISPVGTQNPTVKLLDAPFDWHAGYRLGVGYQQCDDWDSALYYTYYDTRATNNLNAPGQLYSPYIGNFFQNNTIGNNNGPFYDAASVLWKIYYYTLDLEFGHTFHIDERLTLRPYLGLKGAVINQNIHTQWRGPNTLVAKVPTPITTFSLANENLSNDFYGVGPLFGLNSLWPLYTFTQGTFNLIGNVSAAFMWGRWHYHDHYRTNAAPTVTVTGDPITGAAPMTSAVIGLEWLTHIAHVDVSARLSYEAQAWFDQMQMNTLSSGRLNDLMSLQGGVFNLSVNF